MKKLLSLILAVMMVISAFSVTAFADGMKTLDMAPVGEVSTPAEEPAQPAEPAQPTEQEQPAAPAEEPVQEAELPEEAEVQAAGIGGAVPFAAEKTLGVDGIFTLTYTSAGEGKIEEVGTAQRMQLIGKGYVITLPKDAVVNSFEKINSTSKIDCYAKIAYYNSSLPTDEANYIRDYAFDGTGVAMYERNVFSTITFKDGYVLKIRDVKGFGVVIQNSTEKLYDVIILQIEVEPEDTGMDGKGTQSDPYIIKTSENLAYISERCNGGYIFKGTYFKFADDVESVTLPDNWTPIGMTANGFSGNINGNGKTLIVPANSLSLIGRPKGCTIENLNIYGERIPGCGLIEDYWTDCTALIKNITIKSGSHILKSGLLGGYGNESVNIYDCTIEKGVVIGDDGSWGNLADAPLRYLWASPVEPLKVRDMIGSFCGAWNGTITNCVSYATVYGRNYVGGIVGFKGQSMRKCFINNCAFYGDIIATGEGVGGILGSGYLAKSGPNSPCATVENCYATGSVKGKTKVGGIFGGELGVTNNWGNGIGRVRGNYFSGTVSATGENASVGGVIGFMKSMDIFNDVQGNYFVDDCGAANGIGAVETVFNADKVSYNMYVNYGRDDDPMTSELVTKKVTRAQVTNGELVKLLNSGKYGRDNWQQGSEYPVFGEGKHIIGITSMNLYDDSVKAPLESNPATKAPHTSVYETLNAKEILVKYSDGTQEIISASEGKFNFDIKETKRVQLATLTYENYELTFGLKINRVVTGNIKVSLQVLGDSVHGENDEVHTLKNGGLTEWLPMTEYDDVPDNYTVWDFIRTKITSKDVGMRYTMSNGLKAVVYNGLTLSEGDNGKNSRWLFTINGVNSTFGDVEMDQYVSDGDVIVLYFTDDYTKENPTANYDEVKAAKELIEAIGTVTKDSGDAIAAARKAYDALGDAEKSYVDNYDKLVKAEQIYDMIIASNKPAASGKEESTGSVIHIAANGASKGEKNPNTGAPAMSIAPAMLVLAAAALVLKKRG